MAEQVPIVPAAEAALPDGQGKGSRLIAAAGASFVVTAAGAAAAPWLLVHQPLLLVGLSPIPRHMVLVAAVTEMFPFVIVVILRRLLDAALMYWIGRAYGKAAITWLAGKVPRAARFLDIAERVVERLGAVALVLAPGVTTSLLVGSAGMARRVFFPVALVGHTVAAVFMYAVGEALSAQLIPVIAWVRRHVLELSVLFVVAYLVLYVWRRRRRKTVPDQDAKPC